ncbi:MAG: alpha/beta hydrolase [Marinobacter sp.]|nr:alpha/beta hydrolase [Marinobacter sp.]
MPIMRSTRLALVAGLAACLTACVAPVSERIRYARTVADQGDLAPLVFEGSLPLQGFYRAAEPGKTLYVFIEGDGYAWVSPTQPSRNPTPLVPVALQLAAGDAAESLLYLGRPGQYLDTRISQRYWTSARFAPEVVQALADAISQHHDTVISGPVVLVGYSGGGTLAALLAQRLLLEKRVEVAGLITVAGNLAPAYWAHSQGLSPLSESLDPAEQAATLRALPQRHLYGSQDSQVPAAVLKSFLNKMGDQRCVEILPVQATHSGPWLNAWRQSREKPLPCSDQD